MIEMLSFLTEINFGRILGIKYKIFWFGCGVFIIFGKDLFSLQDISSIKLSVYFKNEIEYI